MKTLPFQGQGLAVAFLGAAVIVIGVYRVSAYLSTMNSIWPLIVGVALLAALAASLPILFEKSTWLSVLVLASGLPVAVFVDALFDEWMNQTSRNLFPFEILIWVASASLPVMLGYGAGRIVRSRRWLMRGINDTSAL